MLSPKVLGFILLIGACISYIISVKYDSKLIFFYSCMAGLFGASAFVRILSNPETLKNKYFLLIGINSGVGQEIANILCSVNSKILLINEDAKEENCGLLLKKYPENVIRMKSKPGDFESLVFEVEETLQNKTLRGVIFASDIANRGDVELLSRSRISGLVDKNIAQVVLTVKAFLPLLRESRGRIIFCGHVLGRFALPAFSVYSLTKHALEGFADGLRHEMRRFDVKVVTVEQCNHQSYSYDENLYQSMWSEVTDDAKITYGEDYVRTIAQSPNDSENLTTPLVVSFIEALTAANPKDRYMVCSEKRLVCTSKVETLLSQFVPATVMNFWVDLKYTARLPKCQQLPPPAYK